MRRTGSRSHRVPEKPRAAEKTPPPPQLTEAAGAAFRSLPTALRAPLWAEAGEAPGLYIRYWVRDAATSVFLGTGHHEESLSPPHMRGLQNVIEK